MKSKVTETIFSGRDIVIPLSIVQHIEKQYEAVYVDGVFSERNYNILEGILVITNKTKWSFEYDTWENACYISNLNGEAEKFIKSICDYVAEKDGMLEVEKN
jgi:hypothetical protein